MLERRLPGPVAGPGAGATAGRVGNTSIPAGLVVRAVPVGSAGGTGTVRLEVCLGGSRFPNTARGFARGYLKSMLRDVGLPIENAPAGRKLFC